MLKRDAKALCGSVAIHALLLLLLFLQMPSRIPPFPWPIGARVLNRAGALLPPPLRTAASSPLAAPAEERLRPKQEPIDVPFGPARAPVPHRTLARRRSSALPPRPASGTTRESTETLPDPQQLQPPPDGMAPAFHPTSPLDLSEEAVMLGRSCDIPNELYPEDARQHSQEGITQLRLEVDAKGQVRGARLLRRAGDPLDEMARSWAQLHCRFRPARDRLGRPVASLVTFTYEWRILSKEPSLLPWP